MGEEDVGALLGEARRGGTPGVVRRAGDQSVSAFQTKSHEQVSLLAMKLIGRKRSLNRRPFHCPGMTPNLAAVGESLTGPQRATAPPRLFLGPPPPPPAS